MISTTALTKLYGDFTAVRGISFHVAPGEILGLVGPNGAGKTTTLRCLAGIISPTSGSIVVAGHDMHDDPIAAKRALAFIPDEPHLFDYLTVEEHLVFIGRLYGVADAARRMEPLLDELELTSRRQSLPPELSRGMKQKLAIACGLLHEPSALLLDEPLTGLDPVYIEDKVELESSTIGPNVSISSGSRVKGSELRDTIVGAGSTVVNSVLDQSLIGDAAVVEGAQGHVNVSDHSVVRVRR